MSLRPRHYLLFAVVIGLFVFNIVRHRRAQSTMKMTTTVTNVPSAQAPVQTPAWSAFDHAAGLRDVPNEQFDPAMQVLQQQLSATHNPADSDLRGCVTWLEFYRQGVHHTATDSQMTARSQHHLDGCVRYHQDTIG